MKLSTTQSLRHSQGINWSQRSRGLQYLPRDQGIQMLNNNPRWWLPWTEEPTYRWDESYPGQWSREAIKQNTQVTSQPKTIFHLMLESDRKKPILWDCWITEIKYLQYTTVQWKIDIGELWSKEEKISDSCCYTTGCPQIRQGRARWTFVTLEQDKGELLKVIYNNREIQNDYKRRKSRGILL